MARPETIVPDEPSGVFPIVKESTIVNGFGRGSAELGIPTANIPVDEELNSLETGIYFGWCRISPDLAAKESDAVRDDGRSIHFNNGKFLTANEMDTLPMVMSVGWNPFYQNDKKAAEIHIIHKFKDNFYGASVKFVVLGYIRPELNYTTKGLEALVADINLDIEIALDILSRDCYEKFKYEI